MKQIESINYQIEQNPETGKWGVYKIEGNELLAEFDTRMDAMREMKQRIADEALEKGKEKKDPEVNPDDEESE